MSSVWNQVRKGYNANDLSLVLNNWQYVQIFADRSGGGQEDMSPPSNNEFNPHVLYAFDSEWVIHYWVGDAEYSAMMTTSSGDALYGGVEGYDRGMGNGTITNHAAKSAVTMVHYAHLKKWPGVVIGDGTDFLKWTIWAACENYELPCSGFEPNSDDKEKMQRCEFMLSAFKTEKNIANIYTINGVSENYSEDD